MNKDEIVQELIEWHFAVAPRTKEIYRFITANEQEPGEPIKLLEIDEATIETGRVDAFGFGPAGDVPYPSIVAQVTPNEFARIQRGEIPLPDGWDLNTAQRFDHGWT